MSLMDAQYESRYRDVLLPAARALNRYLEELLDGVPRIDRISVRAKSPNSFLQKASKYVDELEHKYVEPLDEIQDQLGARVIVFYAQDVIEVKSIFERYLRPIEIKSKTPMREWEFGYFGQHLILLIPEEIWPGCARPQNSPAFFELQIKTLFQHAWSEASHDLVYKGRPIPGPDVNRNLALASAQSWGADQIFSELFKRLEGQ